MNKELVLEKDEWFDLCEKLDHIGILLLDIRVNRRDAFKDNFNCDVSVNPKRNGNGPTISLEFESEQEAMIFKLKYL